MKIGIFDPYLDTMSGGEKYMLSAALCLAKQHTVSLFWDPNNADEIIEKAKHRFDFDLSPILFSANVFAKGTSLMQRLIETRHYDRILYLSDGSIPTVAAPLILHFQSPLEWVDKTIKTYLKTRILHRVVCNSQFTKSYIDNKFQVNSRVIYPPVQLQGALSKKKENIILNVGRFGINAQGSSFKKQDVLVEGFKRLVDNGLKEWEFVLIMSVKDGDEDKITEFKKLCTGYPIILVINPENKTLWDYYAKAQIYWHGAGFGEDLARHPDRAEHFGISTVEAMGMGAIPVVYNAGGQKEIVTHQETGILWETVDELVSFTNALIMDAKKMDALVTRGQEKAGEFGSDQFCQAFFEIIK